MNAQEYMRRQIVTVRRYNDAVLNGLTDEQLNAVPPGTCNSIGATFAHILTGEDRFIQMLGQNKPPVWETGGWGEKVGLAQMPGREGWEEVRNATYSLAALQAYAQEVYAATDAYLAALTDEEMAREVPFFNGPTPMADIISLMFVHTCGHYGEIAALKGVQGVQGLPF